MLSFAVRVSGALLLSGGVADGQGIVAGAVSGCYATVEQAVSHSGQQQLAARPAIGYRVQATRWDPVLGRRWATIASCDHPERPTVLIASAAEAADIALAASTARSGASPVSTNTRPVIAVGDAVQMLYQDDRMRMELAAVAESSGNVGDTVRVKVTRYGPEGQGVDQHMTGIVRGPRLLELRRTAGAFQP